MAERIDRHGDICTDGAGLKFTGESDDAKHTMKIWSLLSQDYICISNSVGQLTDIYRCLQTDFDHSPPVEGQITDGLVETQKTSFEVNK